jgi:hypothetical protein
MATELEMIDFAAITKLVVVIVVAVVIAVVAVAIVIITLTINSMREVTTTTAAFIAYPSNSAK